MNPSPKTFLIAYVCSLIMSLLIIIPISVNMEHFKGNCLLYAKGNLSAPTPSSEHGMFMLHSWGNSSNCNYILYMGVTTLVASAVLIWQSCVLVYKEHDRAPFGSFIMFLLNAVVFIALLIASLISSVGYNEWCESITENKSRCSLADLSDLQKVYGINSDGFYTQMSALQVGCWSSLCVWLISSVLAFLKVHYYHKNDDLLNSLAYEKRTLLSNRFKYSRADDDQVL
ncbi:transmembrane protein 179-like [Ciona intestinalis]